MTPKIAERATAFLFGLVLMVLFLALGSCNDSPDLFDLPVPDCSVLVADTSIKDTLQACRAGEP